MLSTQRWVWRALVRSALIPLLLVETLLVGVYLFSSGYIREGNVKLLRNQADEQLINTARLEVNVINEQVQAVAALVEIYRQAVGRALVAPPPQSGAGIYVRNEDGVLYSPVDDGRAASFYSASTPADRQDMTKVYRLEQLDPLMLDMMRTNPMVNAIYFNSWDGYNRIFPWFDTPAQYAPDTLARDYPFYYAADERHNPERKVVWTDVYVDPAGLGWMTSAVAPVYRGDFLEGVVGIDITVATIVEQIQQLDIPWQGYAVLINRKGTIMALPSRGERDFGLEELTAFNYSKGVPKENFKPERFNLRQRPDTANLADRMQAEPDGQGTLVLNGQTKRVAWREIDSAGWQLLTIVDEEAIYRSADELARHFRVIVYLLIVGLLIFYLLFFAYTWRRSVWLSRAISAPLATLNRVLSEIGQERYDQPGLQFKLQELQQSADAVVKMGAVLGRANRAKNRFLSSISHELRTPLTSIIGFAELVQNSNSLGDDERACVHEILRAAEHLLCLINDVLDLAQVQAGQVQTSLESVPVADRVDACLRMIEPQAAEKSVLLQRFFQGRELVVRADANRLSQVLLNLLSNAIKYNHSGGQVSVECARLGDKVRISVRDTGSGITSGRLQELFMPFNRLGYENTSIPGTGIGLSISKQLVELMGGDIGCDSQPGQGSTFWVELPWAGPGQD
ncbi:sensor histidine kinase [Marinobacterium sediminicola]|uniref:histidine kinase n=1 Tax=Marinobacterium sediminicola TaxID=518898 RepID=A0ABY1RZT8_9GAMM|nr:sensor histidine kinase [Marinobacterium sediminicola]ULG69981.1 sensor histidine kinase [Marinobacterium sediminicola]SMR74433.1 Signal transduction histidine kinase [Marinobacterium sediminicola]